MINQNMKFNCDVGVVCPPNKLYRHSFNEEIEQYRLANKPLKDSISFHKPLQEKKGLFSRYSLYIIAGGISLLTFKNNIKNAISKLRIKK